MHQNITHRWLTALGSLTSRREAFLIVVAYGGAWYLIEPETLDFHGWATLATWMMTLFIQRSEHRDTQALHAKLDELIHAKGGAEDGLTRIDDQEPEEIERRREEIRAGD